MNDGDVVNDAVTEYVVDVVRENVWEAVGDLENDMDFDWVRVTVVDRDGDRVPLRDLVGLRVGDTVFDVVPDTEYESGEREGDGSHASPAAVKGLVSICSLLGTVGQLSHIWQ